MKRDPKDCPTCNGWVWNGHKWVRHRVTSGLVCEDCGYDYFEEEKEVKKQSEY